MPEDKVQNQDELEDKTAPTGDNQDKNQSVKSFSQDEVNQIIQDRLEREHKKQEEAAEKVRKAAEETAMAEQKKFEDLAKKRQETIDELTPKALKVEELQAEVDQLNKVIGELAAKQVEDLPDSVKVLLEKLTPVERLDWITKNASSVTVEKKGPGALPKSREDKKIAPDDILNKKRSDYGYHGF